MGQDLHVELAHLADLLLLALLLRLVGNGLAASELGVHLDQAHAAARLDARAHLGLGVGVA